ncbi:hypothetical protein [Tenacibaculum finnmarkense]|uniref:hypothetical protein n=1 Tax=Tenacibaculum finnmarkense TaxID=2781243 RepID=UPI001EFAEAA6|nr:hypothetical protein [Tenacibaculum finnmarkense]MCG8250927.1 hypothetical protein [Tenacibaculum finnmarkense genomovar finnmarkense]MCG8814811.1 hypothetical protein [Tenacibaculum finnmarkense]MCG8819747.1 hypothetical protein [Tenacibaculum finnmarkense]
MDTQFWIDNANSLFHQIFMIIMGGLYGIAYLFGTTYNVINILVYYVLIPSSWIFLISKKTTNKLNFISVGLLLGFILLPDIRKNCNYFFQKSVDFLNWTADIFHSNYIDMSVYICVIVVGIIYIILIPLTLSKKNTKIILISFLLLFGVYMFIIYPNFKKFLMFGIEKMNRKH